MSKRRAKRMQVSVQLALEHMRRFHPGTPTCHAQAIAAHIAERQWTNATLGQIVGITMSTYARHRLTDYERLLRVPGMERDEARMLVAQDLQDVLGTWLVGPPPRRTS